MLQTNPLMTKMLNEKREKIWVFIAQGMWFCTIPIDK